MAEYRPPISYAEKDDYLLWVGTHVQWTGEDPEEGELYCLGGHGTVLGFSEGMGEELMCDIDSGHGVEVSVPAREVMPFTGELPD